MIGPGRLTEAARLYVRPAGPASVMAPQRFLAELPRGSYCPVFGADGAAFELLSKDPSAGSPGLEPGEPDSAGVEAWIEAFSRIPFSSEISRDGDAFSIGDERAVEAGEHLTAIKPLWLVAAAPQLVVLRSSPNDSLALCALPVFGPLTAVCTESATLRALSTDDFLREFGPAALEAAAHGLCIAIAAWDAAERDADNRRVLEAAAHDDEQLSAAQREITSVTEGEAVPMWLAGAQDPLLAAIDVIVRKDGIVVRRPESDDMNLPFEQRLSRIALESRFRYREVSLEGEWWEEEGPPLLVWRTTTKQAMAAVWQRDQFHLLDPTNRQAVPVDRSIASELLRSGFMLYPTLPDRITLSALRRFIVHGAKGDLRAMSAAGALAMLIGLLVPIATGVIVATAIPQGRLSLTLEMALLVAAAAVGVGAFTAARSIAIIRASTIIEERLQAAVWDRVLRMPARFFRLYSTGDLTRRVLAIGAARRTLTGPVLSGLLSGLFASLSFFLMFFYDWVLAIYGFGFAIVTAAAVALLARRELVHLRAFYDAEGRVTGRVVDILGGVNKLRLAAAEERAFARWAEEFAEQQRASWHSGRIRAGLSVVNTLLPSLGLVGLFVVAGYRGATVDLASFSAFNAAFGQFIAAVSSLILALSTALEAIPLLRRAEPIVRTEPEVDAARADPGILTGNIAVRGVSFRYREDGPLVMDGIDFTVEPGQFVAIVGPSGAGKSTILRMLLGFESPLTGAVFYDNRDLAKLDVRLVRRQTGTVLQNAGLMPGSLYENIAGASVLEDEEVMEAAGKAGLAEDIEALPMGLETMVSEDASTLSGGQRQRVMIARALVRKPRILFFDEATSALDNRTQAIVSESLEQLKVARIVIAHRLSTIRRADKILVIERGRLVESGRYEDLMAQEGPFYRLAKRQLL